MIFVFAYNRNHAIEWARSNNLSPKDWRYASNERVLRGVTGFYVELEDWDNNSYSSELRKILTDLILYKRLVPYVRPDNNPIA